MAGVDQIDDSVALAQYYKDTVISAMDALRADGDALEEITSSDFWPYPSYGDMLFSIK